MNAIAITNETSSTANQATKPQTSREIIAANVKLLIDQLEAGHSEGLTAYLTAIGRFHNYSFGNILENRSSEAYRHLRGRTECGEPVGSEGHQGRKGHPVLAQMIGIRRKQERRS